MCVTGFWPKLPRHSLVWLARAPGDSLAREWWDQDRPFIACRRRPGEEISLGFCLPAPEKAKPSRHALAASRQDIGMIARPPLLREVASHLAALRPLLPLASGANPRLIGSAMWQALTNLPFLRETSDLDLVWEVESEAGCEPGLAFFQQAVRLCHGRIDGEFSFPNLGEVAWRELAGPSPQVLLKSMGGEVRLVAREALPGGASGSGAAVHSPWLARAAVAALLEELALYPKPGLVSPHDSGAHADMDFDLMQRSAHSLLASFGELALAPGNFATSLRPLGIRAEEHMLAATNGVNTHRGAIFTLGLLIAAAARTAAPCSAQEVRATLLACYGSELAEHEQAGSGSKSHGGRARQLAGIIGARGEASRGFPSVFEFALPHFRSHLQAGVPRPAAALDTLMALIAGTEDSNLFHRGGSCGAGRARELAAGFLSGGGARKPGWFQRLQQIHNEFTALNLSPGGCADLLAATLFIDRVCCVGEAGRYSI